MPTDSDFNSPQDFIQKMDSGELDGNLASEIKKLTREQLEGIAQILVERRQRILRLASKGNPGRSHEVADIDPNIVSFGAECPKGHHPTLVFNKMVLRHQLDIGTLRLSCSLCGDSWQPNEEQLRIATWLSKQSAPGS